MATKSIVKDINITDRKVAASFAAALEELEAAEPSKVTYTKYVTKLNRDQIRKVFGDL